MKENQRLIQENQDLEERLNVFDYENKQLNGKVDFWRTKYKEEFDENMELQYIISKALTYLKETKNADFSRMDLEKILKGE